MISAERKSQKSFMLVLDKINSGLMPPEQIEMLAEAIQKQKGVREQKKLQEDLLAAGQKSFSFEEEGFGLTD